MIGPISSRPLSVIRTRPQQAPRFGAFLSSEHYPVTEDTKAFYDKVGLTRLRHFLYQQSFQQGVKSLEQGKVKQAITWLQRAMYFSWSTEKIRLHTLLKLGEAFRQDGQMDEAHQKAWGASHLVMLWQEEDPEIYLQTRLLFGKVSIERALSLLETENPQNTQAIRFDSDRCLAEAFQSFAQARHTVENTPELAHVDKTPIYEGEGVIYFLIGKYDEAHEFFDKALKAAEAQNKSPQERLGLYVKQGRVLLAQSGKDSKKAQELIKLTQEALASFEHPPEGYKRDYMMLLRLRLTAYLKTENYEASAALRDQIFKEDPSLAAKGQVLALGDEENQLDFSRTPQKNPSA